MTKHWSAVAGIAVVALGAAGLIRSAADITPSAAGSTGAAPIVVSGAYIRPPVAPSTQAAAYFTIYNTTGTDDTLTSVTSGAGAEAVLHTVINKVMTVVTDLVIPANGSVTFSVGKGHVMITKLFGPLKNGQYVNLELVFANAGPVDVTAPVVAFGSPLPPGAK